MSDHPSQGRTGPLNLDEIIRAALALVDEGGVGGLSMRRLGQRLGVDPMAIYHHAGNRRALIAHMIEHVLAGLRPPDPDGAWADQVRHWARQYRAAMSAHPALIVEAVSHSEAIAAAADRITQTLIDAVAASGLPAAEATGAAHLVVDYVHGAALAGSTSTAETSSKDVDGFELALATIIAGIEHQAGLPRPGPDGAGG